MIEYPEVVHLATQMQETVLEREITGVEIAADRPKFMFVNENLNAYPERLVDTRITSVHPAGMQLICRLDSGQILLIGDLFGRLTYCAADDVLPKKAHAILTFEDDARLVVTIQAWGGFQVLTREELSQHPHAGDQGPSPLNDELTLDRFNDILDNRGDWSRKPIKAFMVHAGNIAGIGNGYLQDILFRAKLNPKRKVPSLCLEERERLYDAMRETIHQGIAGKGRDTEKDLFGVPGSFIPRMDRRAKGQPCPNCGTAIEKISYLGGSCYICPSCQPNP